MKKTIITSLMLFSFILVSILIALNISGCGNTPKETDNIIYKDVKIVAIMNDVITIEKYEQRKIVMVAWPAEGRDRIYPNCIADVYVYKNAQDRVYKFVVKNPFAQ